MSHEPDILLENARIVDGTGAPWFRGSVAVADGRIRTVERGRNHGLGRAARETVDLDRSVLAPGFVDCHAHSDLRLFEEPTLPPKTRQGVTTEVLGQDGFSMAPIYRDRPYARIGAPGLTGHRGPGCRPRPRPGRRFDPAGTTPGRSRDDTPDPAERVPAVGLITPRSA